MNGLSKDCIFAEDGGVLYRFTGYVHLGHLESAQTKLATWQSLRGSSQLEGLHPHQARWVTGSQVSCALFQAQGFFGVTRWNLKRAAEHLNLEMPQMYDPLLTAKINSVSLEENGIEKYPDFVINRAESGEAFGLDYHFDAAQVNEDNEVHVPSTDDYISPEESNINLNLQTELSNLMSNPPLVNTQPKELNDAPSSQSIHITEPSATDLEEQEAPTSSCRVIVSTTVTAIQISTTPSDGQLSTSTQSLKRKLPSSDCPSPSKQSSNESHLQQVKTSRRMAFSGVVTP